MKGGRESEQRAEALARLGLGELAGEGALDWSLIGWRCEEAAAVCVAGGLSASDCARVFSEYARDDFAEWREFERDYLLGEPEAEGLAREDFRLFCAALVIGAAMLERDARRGARAARHAAFDWLARFHLAMRVAMPVATGRRVRDKNRNASERRARGLREQGAATRAAVRAAIVALGPKVTAGAVALRVGITRQRAGQILRELKKAKS